MGINNIIEVDVNALVWSSATILAGILSVLLVCVLLSGMFINTLPVAAENKEMQKSQSITMTVTVGETELSFGVEVIYTLPSEYEVLVETYGEALYSEDFNTCIEGNAVHNDKENIPEGAYYYCANDSEYGGTIMYVRGNGYVLMKEAYGQMVYVKPGIEGIADMKYLVVESKLQYNTPGIEFKFMTRGANSSNKAKIETLGVLKDGVLSKEDGTKIADITAGSWHTFTYVFDIASQNYDLYINGEKIEEDATCRYFRGFNGSDHFRLKAASLTEDTTGADIMIDDIKVYGSVSDPTVITAN